MAGGGGSSYVISQCAYIKSVLHALKHKTAAVNGLLIGRVLGTPADATDASDFTLEILDAVPLFHGQLALLPMLELALLQVDEHLALERRGLQIIGYYHANERFDDNELNGLACKIGDQIVQYCPQAVILLLDNRLLVSLPENTGKKPVHQLYLRDSVKGWRHAGQAGNANGNLILKESTANSLLHDYILEGRDQLLVDFDDHLDDITKDWLNGDLFD